MNGRCHNDLMDFAADICESCGEQFCERCFVFPRGPKGPPFCTHCAMGLSGVRNRRPIKPLGRGEIKRRRKALKNGLSEQESVAPIKMPGTDLINGPDLEPSIDEEEEQEGSSGILGRFRRRRTDPPDTADVDPGQLFEDDDPVYQTTVAGGRRAEDPSLPHENTMPTSDMPTSDMPTSDMPTSDPQDDEHPEKSALLPEHSTATALLNQLREGGNTDLDDDVWLPSSPIDAPTWSLPDVSQQSPLGASGPWGAVATPQAPPADAPTSEIQVAPEPTDAAPVFLTEAQLKAAQRAEGPADKDGSGNWVPPSLRGMDPKAATNGGELTKRRRRTEAPAEPLAAHSADESGA